MKINTRDFGELQVQDDAIYDFPVGIFAFEEARQFALISPLGDDVYPKWLQCTTNIKPCFIVFDPLLIDENYHISLSTSEEKLLKIADSADMIALCIAKVPEDFHDTTLNMKSPIIMNSVSHLAMQVILSESYDFRLKIYKNAE